MNSEIAIRSRHRRSEVGLAEALHACALLGVREGNHAQWLAECLGLAWKEAIRVTNPTGLLVPASRPTASAPSAADTSAKNEPKRLKLLNPVGQEPIAFERLFESHSEKVRHAIELKPATFAAGEERPPFQPLLLERWFQGIFTAVLATQVPSREIDFQKLERSVTQGDGFAQLPFKAQASLVKGVHVLLDRSESMQPFWRDQTELLARLRRLLGETLVQNSWFEYDPLRPAKSRLSWHTPMPRQFREETPVLLVTDFGGGLDPLAARTMEWEPWLPILQQAESSRCRVFALLASSPTSWPTTLSRFIAAALLWDRETSPHMASRLCQR